MKRIATLIITVFLISKSYSQAPEKINYQAIARDASGIILISQAIEVRFSILDGGPLGNIVFREHHSYTTNQFGLFNLKIGTGTVDSGSFAAINWNMGNKYLKVELANPAGSIYVVMGTQELISVPFALYAETAGNSQGDNWGTQAVQTNTTLSGDGTSANMLQIAQQGAAANQVLKWNGTQWSPANDSGQTYSGGTGINISGGNVINNTGDINASDDLTNGSSAGGDLSGTYPNPSVDALQGRTVSANSPNIGQVLKWNGSVWLPENDSIGSGGAGSGVITIDNTNYLAVTVLDDDIINLRGTLTLSANYSKLDQDGCSISGGHIIGTGVEEVSFGQNSVIQGGTFDNLLIDANNTNVFIGCTFNNITQPGFDCRFQGCVFNNCTFTSVQRIGYLSNCELNSSSLTRLTNANNCEFSNCIVGGNASANSYSIGILTGNDFDDCLIYPEANFIGNTLDNSKLVIQVGSDISINGNYFDGLYTGASELIQIDYNDNTFMNVNISGNSFNGNSSTVRYIFLNGAYTGTYGLVKISDNTFIRGTQVIADSSSGMKTIITNNAVKSSTLGVVNGGDLTVRDNDIY